MWMKFIFSIWFGIPALLLLTALCHSYKENKKSALLNHSKMYFQTAKLCLIVGIAATLANLLIIKLNPEFLSTPYLLEMIQLILFPVIFVILAPYAGSIEPPRTLQDRIRSEGFMKVKKDEKNNRRS